MEKEKFDLLEKVQDSSKVDIHYIRQKEPKGLGHAVWCARKFIGNEPFAVILGDDIVKAKHLVLRQLMDEYEQTCSTVSSVCKQFMLKISIIRHVDTIDPSGRSNADKKSCRKTRKRTLLLQT